MHFLTAHISLGSVLTLLSLAGVAIFGTVFSSSRRITDWLKGETEAPTDYSREIVTVKQDDAFETGTVLAKLTSGGKYVQYDPGASVGAGSDNAIALLLNPVDSTDADVTDAVIIARNAVVSDNGIIWPAGITTNQKAAGVLQLAAKGIIVREGA